MPPPSFYRGDFMSKKIQKIPCGGFELGDGLEVKDGKLGLAEGAGGGIYIVTLTKDETKMPFTSAKRLYTADKTADEVYEAFSSGMDIFLNAEYVDSSGYEMYGFYHFVGRNNSMLGFINVEMDDGAVLSGGAKTPIIGYDSIVLASGEWLGFYTNLRGK